MKVCNKCCYTLIYKRLFLELNSLQINDTVERLFLYFIYYFRPRHSRITRPKESSDPTAELCTYF